MKSVWCKGFSRAFLSLFTMLILVITLSACGTETEDEGTSEALGDREDFCKEILYTQTQDIVPEWYIQFDVNPSVGFYVDEEQGYPVCGLVYNNRDAKELLEQVRSLDGPCIQIEEFLRSCRRNDIMV